MTIGIDARPLCYPEGEAFAYTLHLVHALAFVESEFDFHLFCDREPVAAHLPTKDRMRLSILSAPRLLWKASALAPAAARAGCRLLHVQGLLPAAPAMPAVTTIRHLGPLERRAPAAAAWAWRHLLPRQLGRASAVLATSQTGADELARRLAVPPERLHVTPYGVEPAFRPQCESVIAAAARMIGLPERYVVGRAIGGGCDEVVAVWRRACSEHGLQADLVLEGRAAEQPGVRVIRRIESQLGPALLSGARGAILGAAGESTALALLETMACGTPAVGPDATLLREIGGPALAVGDVAAQAAALADLAADEEVRARSMRQGLARARQRTWPGMAEATLAVYRAVSPV